jgi:TPP-dependent pyruvate/acetoin dehydrogenase alpha subunit
MAGCALSFKLKKQPSVALTWTGDGATATGIFHEGMRVAAALHAPLVSVIQDNQVALGTLNTKHHRGHFEGFGALYGLKTWEVDGNHVLACYAAASQARKWCVDGNGPALIIARTFRMGGHATHDEKEARALFSDEIYQQWGQRDPVGCYEQWLMKTQGIEATLLKEIEVEATHQVDQAARFAQGRKESHAPDPQTQQDGVYARPL